MKKPKKRYFEKQAKKIANDIAGMFPACSRPLDNYLWQSLYRPIQKLVNKAYRTGFGRGVRDGMDNPRA